MLTSKDHQIVIKLKQELKSVLPILDFRVFGSRARGDATPDSDLDVFIKTPTYTPELWQTINEIAWEVGFEMERIICPIVATPEQLEQGPLGASPLILNIEKEGIKI